MTVFPRFSSPAALIQFGFAMLKRWAVGKYSSTFRPVFTTLGLSLIHISDLFDYQGEH